MIERDRESHHGEDGCEKYRWKVVFKLTLSWCRHGAVYNKSESDGLEGLGNRLEPVIISKCWREDV